MIKLKKKILGDKEKSRKTPSFESLWFRVDENAMHRGYGCVNPVVLWHKWNAFVN